MAKNKTIKIKESKNRNKYKVENKYERWDAAQSNIL